MGHPDWVYRYKHIVVCVNSMVEQMIFLLQLDFLSFLCCHISPFSVKPYKTIYVIIYAILEVWF